MAKTFRVNIQEQDNLDPIQASIDLALQKTVLKLFLISPFISPNPSQHRH